MKKNIAFFLNSLGSGGAERVISRLSSRLKHYYNIYIFLIENPNQFYECDGRIIVLGKDKYNYRINAISAAIKIGSIIKKNKISCVISFLDVPNIINIIFNSRVPKIISIRDCNEVEGDLGIVETFKSIICNTFYRRADATICVCKELTQKSIERYKLTENRTYTIENPYDVLQIREYAKEHIEESIFEFIKSHNTSVAVGRLEGQKGYEDLIEIFIKVSQKCSDAALIIIGEGTLERFIQQTIKKNKLEGKILLLGPKKNPFAYMAKCSLYVSASKHEGFPNTLVEALACSLPVIHTDCMTGPREILSNANCFEGNRSQYLEYGVLVPSYTRGEISKEAMYIEYSKVWLNLLQDEKARKAYSVGAIERAEYYNMDKCAQKYIQVIEEMESRRAKGSRFC